MVEGPRSSRQEELEARLSSLASRPVEPGATPLQAYGPLEDWLMPLGGRDLFLDPRTSGWYYYDRAGDRIEHTGYLAGEVTFCVENGEILAHARPLPATPSASSAWCLVLGSGGGRTYPLQGETTVGRAEGNDVLLQGDLASRRHAVIRRQGDSYVIEDLGSRNGTFVNGARISAPTPLRPGDTIAIGEARLVVSIVPAT